MKRHIQISVLIVFMALVACPNRCFTNVRATLLSTKTAIDGAISIYVTYYQTERESALSDLKSGKINKEEYLARKAKWEELESKITPLILKAAKVHNAAVDLLLLMEKGNTDIQDGRIQLEQYIIELSQLVFEINNILKEFNIIK